MIKRSALVVAAVGASLIAVFVAKETLFFDSKNPYGAKVISPAIRDSLPSAVPPQIEDFILSSKHPLPEEEARRVALEFAAHRLGLDRHESSSAQISEVLVYDGSRIFVIASRGGAELARVQMDRLGRLSIIADKDQLR